MRRFRGIAALVLIIALAVAAGCAKKDSTDKAAAAVVTVNGEDISRATLDTYVEQYASAAGTMTAEQQAEYRVMLLDMIVETALIRQEAERLGADLSDAAVTAEFERLMAGVDAADYESYLAGFGLTLQDAKDSVRDQLAYDFLSAYVAEQNPDLTITETYSSLQHILVDEEALANELAKRIADGEDFAALAGEYSTDPGSGANGGNLGWSATSAYVPEFAAAADALAVGEVSVPVKSDFGWHIIKKVAEVTAGTPLAEVPAEATSAVSSEALNTAFQAYVQTLRDKATIVYVDKTLQP